MYRLSALLFVALVSLQGHASATIVVWLSLNADMTGGPGINDYVLIDEAFQGDTVGGYTATDSDFLYGVSDLVVPFSDPFVLGTPSVDAWTITGLTGSSANTGVQGTIDVLTAFTRDGGAGSLYMRISRKDIILTEDPEFLLAGIGGFLDLQDEFTVTRRAAIDPTNQYFNFGTGTTEVSGTASPDFFGAFDLSNSALLSGYSSPFSMSQEIVITATDFANGTGGAFNSELIAGPVPEPGHFVLLTAAAGCVAVCRRLRTRQQQV